MAESQDSTLPLNLDNVLDELFQAHRVATSREEQWIVFPGFPYKAQARIVRTIPNPSGVSVQLDVRIHLRPGQMLVESCGGVGQDEQQAIAEAMQGFASNSFHVLIAALFSLPNDHAHREEWLIDGLTRHVTFGDLGVRGMVPPEFFKSVFEPLIALIKGCRLTPGIHWIRVFYAQGERKTYACEVLMDNAPWEETQAAVAQLAWPSADKFYSVRLFLVIEGGIGIGEAVEIICRSGGRKDGEIIAQLHQRGAPVALAEHLTGFIPIAFGRVLLGSLSITFLPTVTLRDPNTGVEREMTLRDDPYYAEALKLAEAARSEGTMSQEEFLSVAQRSAEVNAVNKALNAGHRVENWKFSQLVMSCSLEQQVPLSTSAKDRIPEQRPFWRFWSR